MWFLAACAYIAYEVYKEDKKSKERKRLAKEKKEKKKRLKKCKEKLLKKMEENDDEELVQLFKDVEQSENELVGINGELVENRNTIMCWLTNGGVTIIVNGVILGGGFCVVRGIIINSCKCRFLQSLTQNINRYFVGVERLKEN